MRSFLTAVAVLSGCGGPPVEKATYGEYVPYEAGDDTGDTGAEPATGPDRYVSAEGRRVFIDSE